MLERRWDDEEELLADMSHLPELSANLRSRVLAAALEARARRTQGRRVIVSALVVFCLAGWATWSSRVSTTIARQSGTGQLRTGQSATGQLGLGQSSETLPAAMAARSDAAGIGAAGNGSAGNDAIGPDAASPPSVFSRRDMLISAMGDDWRMVEAEFKSREEFTRRVHM